MHPELDGFPQFLQEQGLGALTVRNYVSTVVCLIRAGGSEGWGPEETPQAQTLRLEYIQTHATPAAESAWRYWSRFSLQEKNVEVASLHFSPLTLYSPEALYAGAKLIQAIGMREAQGLCWFRVNLTTGQIGTAEGMELPKARQFGPLRIKALLTVLQEHFHPVDGAQFVLPGCADLSRPCPRLFLQEMIKSKPPHPPQTLSLPVGGATIQTALCTKKPAPATSAPVPGTKPSLTRIVLPPDPVRQAESARIEAERAARRKWHEEHAAEALEASTAFAGAPPSQVGTADLAPPPSSTFSPEPMPQPVAEVTVPEPPKRLKQRRTLPDPDNSPPALSMEDEQVLREVIAKVGHTWTEYPAEWAPLIEEHKARRLAQGLPATAPPIQVRWEDEEEFAERSNS